CAGSADPMAGGTAPSPRTNRRCRRPAPPRLPRAGAGARTPARARAAPRSARSRQSPAGSTRSGDSAAVPGAGVPRCCRRSTAAPRLGDPLTAFRLLRGDDQRGSARAFPGVEALLDPLDRADERLGVAPLVGHRRNGFVLAPRQIELLDALGRILEAVA